MFPFIATDIPDQFYRLFTSLLLHAGILHVAITVAFQHIFLADLERLVGPLRTAIIYIGSGIAGNLTSSLLVPYKTEVSCLSFFLNSKLNNFNTYFTYLILLRSVPYHHWLVLRHLCVSC